MATAANGPLSGLAMVTGGSAGIGLAFAKALAARGCDLVLVARNAERLETTAQKLRDSFGVDVEVLAADLSDAEQTTVIAQRLQDQSRPIDILVNNAGSGLHAKFHTGDLDVHTRALDLMVRAVLVLGSTAARAMAERGSGVIINVGSVAGLLAMNHYSAIKSWVNTFSDALALEMRGTGVQVLGLLPGWVRTEFHQRAKIKTSSIPGFLWLDADELIHDTLKAVEAGKTRVVPSKRFRVISFFLKHLPRPVERAVSAKIQRGR